MPSTEATNRPPLRRVSVALVAVTCTAGLAACGAGSRSATTGVANGGMPNAIKFAGCMRAHGVSNFPDPTAGPGGGINIGGPGSGIDPASPTFQSAQKACSKLMPGPSGPPRMTESGYLAALRFAKCMRGHGLADFPDPTRSPSAAAGNTLDIHGMVFQVDTGLNPMSPVFRHSAKACGLGFP